MVGVCLGGGRGVVALAGGTNNSGQGLRNEGGAARQTRTMSASKRENLLRESRYIGRELHAGYPELRVATSGKWKRSTAGLVSPPTPRHTKEPDG